MEQKPDQQQKTGDNKIQATEIKFLSEILNKTKEDRIRNTNIKLKLGMTKIRNDTQKNRLRRFQTCNADDRREDT